MNKWLAKLFRRLKVSHRPLQLITLVASSISKLSAPLISKNGQLLIQLGINV
ncbi:hypothetical protein ACOMICROBIO_EPCKBFOG_00495 [Vibrio sp. B1FLJ16]|nr:hypothetical protein ACOMICROBIO_EPCKBFOG_00495 [Vibrio sp. B1FLJ16]CAE6886293.1 hypothetical protein ACOMICROBIO_EPCKBFOG_00495 [Vibrio sp. B1FLJ16]